MSLQIQIEVLEKMEWLAGWIVSAGESVAEKHLRNVLTRKYRRMQRLALRNVRGVHVKIPRLRSHEHYRARAYDEVDAFFGDSHGLGLHRVFDTYRDVHGHDVYREFLENMFDVEDKSGFRYAEYLDAIRMHLSEFMRIMHGMARRKQDFVVRSTAEDFSQSAHVCSKVYCIPCAAEISSSVYRHHVEGKRHRRNGGDGVLFVNRPVVDIENEIAEILGSLEKTQVAKPEVETIPKWLLRQRDLDVLFECGICGYHGRGREPFDVHFSEKDHVDALREHGMEYSAVLRGITRLETALRLRRSRDEFEEEFEDAEGNVYDWRTYDDLRRNNLI